MIVSFRPSWPYIPGDSTLYPLSPAALSQRLIVYPVIADRTHLVIISHSPNKKVMIWWWIHCGIKREKYSGDLSSDYVSLRAFTDKVNWYDDMQHLKRFFSNRLSYFLLQFVIQFRLKWYYIALPCIAFHVDCNHGNLDIVIYQNVAMYALHVTSKCMHLDTIYY